MNPMRTFRTSYARLQRVFLTCATLSLIVGALYLARAVLIPIVSAVLLTFILSPVVSWLQHKRLGRVPAVVLVTIFFCAGVGSLGAAFLAQTEELATDLAQSKD